MSDFKDRIRKVRESNELTQDAFAKLHNETKNKIFNIETDRTKPSSQLLRSIVEKMPVNAYWLLTGEGDMYVSGNAQERLSVPQNNKDAEKECLLIKNESHKRLAKFLSYYAQSADDVDFAWLEGQVKRNVPEYADFIMQQSDVRKRA